MVWKPMNLIETFMRRPVQAQAHTRPTWLPDLFWLFFILCFHEGKSNQSIPWSELVLLWLHAILFLLGEAKASQKRLQRPNGLWTSTDCQRSSAPQMTLMEMPLDLWLSCSCVKSQHCMFSLFQRLWSSNCGLVVWVDACLTPFSQGQLPVPSSIFFFEK